MDRTLTLDYDDQVVRAGLRGYVRRYLGWKFRSLVAIIAAGFAALAVQGIWHWYTLLLGAILGLCTLVPLIIHGVMLPMLTRRFRLLYGDQAQFRFTDAGLTVTTPRHSGHTPWPALKRLWRLPHVWLLFTGTDSFTMMPAAGLPEDVRAFIIGKVERNGGEVA